MNSLRLSKDSGSDGGCGEVPEEYVLLQMDQELDQRLNRLCMLRTGMTPSNTPWVTGPSTRPRSAPQASDGQQRSLPHNTNTDFSGTSSSNVSDRVQNVVVNNSNQNVMVSKRRDTDDYMRGLGAQTSVKVNEDVDKRNKEELMTGNPSGTTSNQTIGTGDMSDKSNVGEEEVDEDEESNTREEEAIFDEFLDHSTRVRINMLTKKVSALTEALKFAQGECKRLSCAKREASGAAQAAETERRTLSKQVHVLQQETSKLQKSNKHLQERVKELGGECQGLRKELSSRQQGECERRSAQSSHQAQLTRSRADNATLRDQMAILKTKHKEEVDQLRSSVANSNARVKELERQQRNYSALVKKQEKLITILNEQKNNIAAAKTVVGLEEKFLSVVSQLQPP
ncbi:uncharacterized protein LOC121869084 isoform X2 [Homarus americanus]|uniref:uncharacterized protein LOC121869084 isoform X2 n=1 Tax=Homarus americanus TaxID=6706 RepID=UPI001C438499|nr:uncharacterized protein LOC121869084 isoform X2 [Homarus americanus]